MTRARQVCAVVLVISASLAAACAVGARKARRDIVLPAAASDVFARATSVLLDLGYTIVDANRQLGILRADRVPRDPACDAGTELTVNIAPTNGGTRVVAQPRCFTRQGEGLVQREQVKDVERSLAALRAGSSTRP